MTKTIWNDKQGARDRQQVCYLIPFTGEMVQFTGKSIEGVCHAIEIEHEKNGKWSNTTYEIIHKDTTAVVFWHQDWDSGYYFPQVSWELGFLWLASKAPVLNREFFETHIRKEYLKTARRWDEAAKAVVEFGFSATPEELGTIAKAKENIEQQKLLAEKEEQERRANSPFAALLKLR